MKLTERQKLNLAQGLTKNGFSRTGFGRMSKVNLYLCPKCGNLNRIIVNWHGPAPRGGFYCNGNCGQVIGF